MRPAPNPTLCSWALDVLRAPGSSAQLQLEQGQLVDAAGREVGRVEGGVVRFPTPSDDPNITFYRSIGGAHFHERANAAFAMSSLDTPVYHELIAAVRPPSMTGMIVDVGGGDGRNARPWLDLGFQRVVVVDAIADALMRFRDRVAAEKPEWLERLLLIEADARALPLATGSAQTVLAVEALCYLNEDYERGLGECMRLLAGGGSLLVSERDYEGAIVGRLLYEGPRAMLETAGSGFHWDGPADSRARTRTFTEAQLVQAIEAQGGRVASIAGTSLIPLLTGWMAQRGAIAEEDRAVIPQVVEMLRKLALTGRLRRTNVVVARRVLENPER